MTNVNTVPRLWHTQEDAALLCDDCGLTELNNAFPVMLGLVEPFTSIEDALERFRAIESIEGDYFIQTAEGECAECGATVEAGEVA